MVFHITFVLALFQDKKCSNFIKLFPCILWDLIVMGLILSWWRLLKTVKIRNLLATESPVDNPQKVIWEAHAGSWRVNCHTVFYESLHNLAILRVNYETLYLDVFKCDSYVHPYYIYPGSHKSVRRLFKRKP